MEYEIVKVGAPILREKAKPVTHFGKKLGKLLKDMGETMYKADGCGLAAPQIGLGVRAIVIDAGDGAGLREFVNPVLSDPEGESVDEEGCLSVPDYNGEVKRAAKITVHFQNCRGEHYRLRQTAFWPEPCSTNVTTWTGFYLSTRQSACYLNRRQRD